MAALSSCHPPLIGLLGANVSHSRLPRLFMEAWRRLGVQGALCVPLDLDSLGPSSEVDADRSRGTYLALQAAKTQGFRGLAVTMPCKEHAARACDKLDRSASAILSVNCVQFDYPEDGGAPTLIGKNLDGWGAALALKEAVPDLEKPTVLILGAGGVALSVAEAYSNLGAKLWLHDIDRVRADTMAATLAANGAEIAVCASPEAVLGECSGVANCTPVGMHGGPPGSPLAMDLLRRHPKVEWVFDVVCYPVWTPLLRAARQLGRTPVLGMRMNDFIQREMFAQLTGEDAEQLPADIFPTGVVPAESSL